MTDWQPYRSIRTYLDVGQSIRIPIWKERRLSREVRAARTMPAPVQSTEPRDILLVHGFLDAGDSMRLLERRLANAGHRVQRADIGRNVDCGERMAGRLSEEVRRVSSEAGGPLLLVGHSRGGQLSRVMAVRHQDEVAAIVTAGSDLTDPFGIALALKLVKLGMRVASKVGVKGLIDDCFLGDCCFQYHQDLLGPFPEGTPFVSIYSRSDGVVDPRVSRDSAAKLVEVDSTHSGMVIGPVGVGAIERAIEEFPVPA